MANLSKWNISIEYGPTSADVHEIVVDASSSKDAKLKAEQWAKDNNVANPMFSEPYEDSYDEILDWTIEEEEEFMHIVEMGGDSDER
jgi:hypothetical protein